MAKKNTDETILDVQEVYSKSEQFFEDNKRIISGLIIAVIIIVLGFLLYNRFVKAPANLSANESIAKAEAYWIRDSTDLAVAGDPSGEWEGLEYLADEHSGSSVGKRANYMMGIYKRDNQDFEAALGHFKNSDFGSPILGAFVNGNIGDCLVELGAEIDGVFEGEGSDPDALDKYEEALPYFIKAASSSADDMTTMVYYKKAANVCLKLGMYSKAEKMYDGILTNATSATSAEYKEAERMKALCAAKQMAQ